MNLLELIQKWLGIEKEMSKESFKAIVEMLSKDMDSAVQGEAVARFNRVLNDTDKYYKDGTPAESTAKAFAAAQFIRLRPNSSVEEMQSYWYIHMQHTAWNIALTNERQYGGPEMLGYVRVLDVCVLRFHHRSQQHISSERYSLCWVISVY